jgi:hypothetical protein
LRLRLPLAGGVDVCELLLTAVVASALNALNAARYSARRWSNAALNAAIASICAALGRLEPATAPSASACFKVADKASISVRSALFRAARWASSCACRSASAGAGAAVLVSVVGTPVAAGNRRPSSSVVPSSCSSPLSASVPPSAMPASGPPVILAEKVYSIDCISLLVDVLPAGSVVLTARVLAVSRSCTDAACSVGVETASSPPPQPKSMLPASAMADKRKR